MNNKVHLDQIFSFENARVLSNFEAHEAIESVRSDYNDDSRKQIFDKADNYADHCSQFSNMAQVNAARSAIKRILRERRFDDEMEEPKVLSEKEQEKRDQQIEYDTVMLLNLCPDSIEEARAFIWSLNEKSDDQVQEIIDQLSKFRI